MVLLFVTIPSKVPLPMMVPLLVTFPSKVPLPMMVPSFVTLHVFWKVPPLMVP